MSEQQRRIRVATDEYPDVPDWDAHVPVIWVPFIGPGVQFCVGKDYLPDLGVLRRARGSLGWELMERWLNIFVGPTRRLNGGDDRDGYYYAVVTPEWQEMTGLTDEHLAEATLTLKDSILNARMPFEDYLDGEVFIIVPEVLVTWTSDDNRTEERWEDDPDNFAVHGYYGREHVESTCADEYPGIDVVWEDDDV